MKHVLVTGSTGFIGSNLVRHLLSKDYQVSVIARRDSNFFQLNDCKNKIYKTIYFGGNLESITKPLEGISIDAIFHLAANCCPEQEGKNIEALINSNILFGTYILETAKRNNIRFFINTGTYSQHYEGASFNPCTLYDSTKQCFEDILKFYHESSNISAITLALSDTYGPNDPRKKLIKLLRQSQKSQQPLQLTPGNQEISYIHIHDIVHAYETALELLLNTKEKILKHYAVCSQRTLSVKDLVDIFEKASTEKCNVQFGAKPYRPREQMKIWGKNQVLPHWEEKYTLEEGFKELLNQHSEIEAPSKQAMKLISIMIPAFNEEPNINYCFEKVYEVIQPLMDKYNFEVIFCDNHSEDGTFEAISNLASKYPFVRGYRFSRNFGFQNSIKAGIEQSKGDAFIQLDCDLEDPPEMIPEFLSEWEKGYKVVYGVRKNREEGLIMKWIRKCFYRMINYLSDIDLPLDAGDFRLIDKEIINEVKKNNDKNIYLRGLIAEIGFNQKGIPYARSGRKYGQSKFKMSDLIQLAFNGIVNHSNKPLYISALIGTVFAILTFTLLIIYFVLGIINHKFWPAGFTSIILSSFISISLNCFFFSIIGCYIGRIFNQIRSNPKYIIEKKTNER